MCLEVIAPSAFSKQKGNEKGPSLARRCRAKPDAGCVFHSQGAGNWFYAAFATAPGGYFRVHMGCIGDAATPDYVVILETKVTD
jgi:hypothetical protein